MDRRPSWATDSAFGASALQDIRPLSRAGARFSLGNEGVGYDCYRPEAEVQAG